VKTEVQGRQRSHGYADYMRTLDGETVEHGNNVVPVIFFRTNFFLSGGCKASNLFSFFSFSL
jgi:hypothetical protein